MDNGKKPIKKLYVGEATIMDVGAKPAGVSKFGKKYEPKIFVEVRTNEGNWMMIDFKQGNEYDAKKLVKLMAMFNLKEKKDLPRIKNERLAIFVAPGISKDGRVFWNVREFFDVKYLKDEMEAALGEFDFGSLDSPAKNDTATDDLPF